MLRGFQEALGARCSLQAAFGNVVGLKFSKKCLVWVSSSVLSLAALALVCRFAVVPRFRRKFVLQLSSFSLRAKRHTSQKCNTLHAKTRFFKVRARAAASEMKRTKLKPE